MYREIAENIFFIEGQSRGRYPYANSMLINDRVTVLIDTGPGPDRLRQVAGDFKVDLILLSHGHEDHISGNNIFPGAKIAAHALDAPAVRRVSRLIELFGVQGTEMEQPFYDFLESIFQLQDSRVDRELQEGEKILTGDHELHVIHTPGHSGGHCSFLLPDAGVIFLGDIDLSTFGPFYGYLDSDINLFIQSVDRLKTIDFEIAVTSHKELISGRKSILEKLDLYCNKIYEREEKLLQFLEQERTLSEIVAEAIIYGRFPEPQKMYALMEKMMMLKHLERLTTQGLISAEDGIYQAV